MTGSRAAGIQESAQDAATPIEAANVDAPPLHDPFALCKPGLVADFSRENRVQLLGQFAEAVLAGVEPSKGSMMFVASGLAAWLSGSGGNLIRDHWRVAGPQGCTVTESILWRRMKAGAASSLRAQQDAEAATLEAFNQNQDGTK
jgi:hypothetical protein